MPPELKALLGQADTLAKQAQGAVLSATLDIRKEIVYLSGKLNVAGSADAREAVFAEVSKKIAKLNNRLNKLFLAAGKTAAQHGAAQASKDTGVAVKLSKEHTDEIVGTLKATGGENLAATMTQAMNKNIVSALRDATVSAFREQAVSGMTMKELEKVLKQKWEAVADDPKNLQFIDRAGRVWDTDTYINMQTRTNATRIYNDALVESIGKATGSDLVMVSRGGDPHCRLCFPWEGRILSITGKTAGFPTYEEAREAGLFHPNCTHTLEPVDEEFDADEIALQRKFTPPEGLKPSDMDEQRYQMDIQRKIQEEGVSATEAKVAVDRDNLTAALRQGLILENAEEVVGAMTDEQVNALCPDGNPPEFVPVKDNPTHTEEWNKGKAGGILYINPKAVTTERILDVAQVEEGLPVETIEAPVKFIGNTKLVDEAIQACERAQSDAQSVIAEVNVRLNVVKKARNKVQMAFIRAGVSGKDYLAAFDGIEADLAELKMEAKQDFDDAQASLAAVPEGTPDSREEQDAYDASCRGLIADAKEISKRAEKRVSDLEAGVYDGKVADIENGVQAEIDRLIGEKAKVSIERCRAIRAEISTKGQPRRDLKKRIDALLKAGANGGAKLVAFNALSDQMATIDGQSKVVVMHAVMDFNGKDYQKVLAAEKQCEDMLAKFLPMADAIGQLGAEAVQELEAAAKTTAADAEKAAEAERKPIDTKLPAYKFPKDVTSKMLDDMSAKGKRLGGTTGALLVEVDGQKYIMKRGGNTSDEHLENELLGNAAYRAAGIRAPDFRSYKVNGETVSLTQFIPNGKTLDDYLSGATPAQRKKVIGQLREGFALDALMGNWDVLGANQDNVLVDKEGNVWRIDNGSAFGFRAMGAKKGAEFWENRKTLEDVWSMRSASINRGVFDGLSTGQVFRDAKRIDFDAVMKALPKEYQRNLEKPLAEMKSLIRECGDIDKGGYTDDHASAILDDMHQLRKVGFHDRIAEINAEFKATHGEGAKIKQGNIPKILRFASTDDEPAPDGFVYSQKITDAVISVKHHWKKNTPAPNEAKVKAAVALIPELEKNPDPNAKTLLNWAKALKQTQQNGYDKKLSKLPSDEFYVPSVSVKPIPSAAKSKADAKDLSTMVREFINDDGSGKPTSGFSFIEKTNSSQGTDSWDDSAARSKILAYACRGLDWDYKTANPIDGGDVLTTEQGAVMSVGKDAATNWRSTNYKARCDFYRAHPDEFQKDLRAFRAMKAATHTLFRELNIDGLDGEDFISVRRERDTDVVRRSVQPKGWGVFNCGGCESTATFRSQYPSTGDITVRRIPLSRLNATFLFSTNKRGGSLLAGDGESETTADLCGDIPCWNWGHKSGSIDDLSAVREAFLKAEKARK